MSAAMMEQQGRQQENVDENEMVRSGAWVCVRRLLVRCAVARVRSYTRGILRRRRRIRVSEGRSLFVV